MGVGSGRKKGSLNKITVLLKDAIVQAATKAGGGDLVKYLTLQAKENPGPFMALLGKVIPLQISGENGEAIRIIVETGVPRADKD